MAPLRGMLLLMANPILQYLRELTALHKAGNATEHSFRPAFQALVESYDKCVAATNEPKRIACGAPDFIVARGDETLGYIECKDLGASLDEIEKSEQMTRYLDGIDNLILTNYLEFRYYLNGEMEMQVFLARLPEKGRLKPLLGAEGHLRQLFEVFFAAKAAGIADPMALAARLARVAQVIRDAIMVAFDQEDADGSLHIILEGFRQTLLHDITREQFADMYAQTVCYGMFSARVNVPNSQADQFSRRSAAIDLPATNPFLREVFEYIAGTRLNNSVVWAVDLLADILRRCDMAAVLRDFGKADRREDPVVHFYESFLAAYDPALRESRGVYYTPEPVVSYIVRSVDAILKSDFGCAAGLADNTTVGGAAETHRVQILDPATGTGTFLYETVRHIYETLAPNRGAWAGERGYVATHLLPRLHGFELMMAPYAVAHLKLGWLLKDTGYTFPHNERLRIYLTNTLDEAGLVETAAFPFADHIAREANAARNIKTDAPIMVVLGNPPYSGHSANNNAWSKALINDPLPWQGGAHGYFTCDDKPLGERNPKWLNDDYVKFIRFGQYRIERTGYGVLAFITNHGYLDNPTFRGMRQSLMQTFDEIYLIDLHGNVKKRETAPDGSKDENVFDIQQGVSISIFVRKENVKARKTAKVFHTEIHGPRQSKYDWLNKFDVRNTPWKHIKPQQPFYLFKPLKFESYAEYQQGWNICAVMPVNSVGIVTARDNLAIQFTKEAMWDTVRDFSVLPPEEAREKYNLGKDARDWKVSLAQDNVNSSGPTKDNIYPILYRPFDQRFTYYTQ
ncbi:MAG TPA: DNA methyltransferase, partial [Candidatus Hydrogenedentes bacterium]|nr:DNA methyltransferase [Candidatus Hydrogenedentota bacterium]